MVVRSRDPNDPPVITPPCFNSGLISIHRPWVHALVSSYVDCFKRLTQHNLLGENRYFNEQTALAIAVIKCGVPYEIDNHRMDKSFFHYYSLQRLAAFDTPRARVTSCVENFPGLGALLACDGLWQAVMLNRQR